MARILIIEFWNISPHLETALEIAKRHLESNDHVEFQFWGNGVLYKECIGISKQRATCFLGKTPETTASELLRHPNFHYYEWDEQKYNLSTYREVPKFNDLSELIKFKYDDEPVGLAIASSLVSKTANAHLIPAEHQSDISSMYLSYFSVLEKTLATIERLKPDLIYTFNGRFCNYRAVLRAAERTGVKILLHERGSSKDKYVTYNHLPHDRAEIQKKIMAAWNKGPDNKSQLAEQFYIDRRQGRPKDWFSFTGLQVEGRMPALPKEKRIFVYFSSSDDEFVAVGEMFKSDVWLDQMDAVLYLISLFEDRTKQHLVVRLHPHLLKKSAEDRNKWLALNRFKHVTVLPPESDVSTYSLIDNADAVITYGSTVGIEAVFWGKPSILLAPSFYDQLECSYRVTSKDDLVLYLNDNCLMAEKSRVLPYGYYFNTYGIEYKYYQAESLANGKFLGVNLQRVSLFYQIARIVIRHLRNLFLKTKGINPKKNRK